MQLRWNSITNCRKLPKYLILRIFFHFKKHPYQYIAISLDFPTISQNSRQVNNVKFELLRFIPRKFIVQTWGLMFFFHHQVKSIISSQVVFTAPCSHTPKDTIPRRKWPTDFIFHRESLSFGFSLGFTALFVSPPLQQDSHCGGGGSSRWTHKRASETAREGKRIVLYAHHVYVPREPFQSGRMDNPGSFTI